MAACTLVRGADNHGDDDGVFEVGETWVYTCNLTAVAGTNTNTATADSTETPPDTDGASYFGNAPALKNEDIELIRQWILFGAPATGQVVDKSRIQKYYNGQGETAFPAGPPPAPAPGTGFQLRIGPFFLNEKNLPGDELEYFQKVQLELEPLQVDVRRGLRVGRRRDVTPRR